MSNAAALLDYLFVRGLIQARLADQEPLLATGNVSGVEDLAQAVERGLRDTTAFVLWEGDVFDTSEQGRAGAGKNQLVQQQWSVILAVRNADQNDADARNASAGPLLAQVHKALAGWVPEGAFRPLLRVQGRRANYTPNVGLYPLTFALPLSL